MHQPNSHLQQHRTWTRGEGKTSDSFRGRELAGGREMKHAALNFVYRDGSDLSHTSSLTVIHVTWLYSRPNPGAVIAVRKRTSADWGKGPWSGFQSDGWCGCRFAWKCLRGIHEKGKLRSNGSTHVLHPKAQNFALCQLSPIVPGRPQAASECKERKKQQQQQQ